MNWNNLTKEEKIDAMAVLLVKVADHLPGGRVAELEAENSRLRKKVTFLNEALYRHRAQLQKLIKSAKHGSNQN